MSRRISCRWRRFPRAPIPDGQSVARREKRCRIVALAKAKPGELTYRLGRRRQPAAASVRRAVRAEAPASKLGACAVSGSPKSVTDLVAGRIAMSFIVGSSVHRPDQGRANLQVLATIVRQTVEPVPQCADHDESGDSGFDFNAVARAAGTGRNTRDRSSTTLANAASKAMQYARCGRMPCTSKVTSPSMSGRTNSGRAWARKSPAGPGGARGGLKS